MKKICYLLYAALTISCSNNAVEVVNPYKNTLKSTYKMVEKESKNFKLDSVTASKPRYMRLVYNDSTKKRELTFFNDYSHEIQFYDYDRLSFLKRIQFDNSSDGILKAVGYHIKNKDSIYLYDLPRLELCLANGKGKVLKKTSLIGNLDIKRDPWFYKYPQYYPSTVTPLLGTGKGLLIIGQSMEDIQDTIINKFKYFTYVDKKLNQSKVIYSYPKELYGSNYIWGDPIFTQVFYDVVPTGKGSFKIIFSYPVSHSVYLSDGFKEQNRVQKYAGSNYAGTIKSLDDKKISSKELRDNFMKNDMYGAILYDKYRKVYYRFLRRAVKESDNKFNLKDKPIAVIVYDNQFNYLGETDLGPAKECHWENSFVTKEGLNIEWVNPNDIEEANLILKIFVLKKIKKES